MAAFAPSELAIYTPAGKRAARDDAAAQCSVARSTQPEHKEQLGALDAQFAGGYPSIVELLIVLPDHSIDAARFVAAATAAARAFPGSAARRDGASLAGDAGVAVSIVEGDHATPAPHRLFGAPGGGMSLRVANGANGATVGASFDHALCDVSGAALFLEAASAAYCGAPAPAAPSLDRGAQAAVAVAPPPAGAEPARVERRKGGCGCVEWALDAAAVDDLRRAASAQTRHDAVFASIVVLLRRAGAAARTASIARDARRPGGGLPARHFGNGGVLVEAAFGAADDAAACAARVRAAVDGGDAFLADSRRPSDVHLTSWCARRDVRFGASDCAFAVGPGTVATAARFSALRGGQPVATVLPGLGGGLRVSVVAPTAVATKLRGLLAATPRAPRAALVWLHGLGDVSDHWRTHFERALPGVELRFPAAPPRPVAARGGETMPSWFDLETWPVSADEPAPDLDGAIAAVREAVGALGVPPGRVVVGGFSQGGAAAIAAALAAAAPYAGVVAVSGWCAQRPPPPAALPRLFFSAGTSDPAVTFKLAKRSGQLLAALAREPTVSHVQRAKHDPTPAELAAVDGFIRDVLR